MRPWAAAGTLFALLLGAALVGRLDPASSTDTPSTDAPSTTSGPPSASSSARPTSTSPRPTVSLVATTSSTTSSTTPQSRPFRVVAVGDVACPPDDPSFNGGRGTARHCQHVAVGAQVAAAKPEALLLVGDLQYRDGTPEEFEAVWNRTWATIPGPHYPVPGNHEYQTPGAPGYFRTFATGRGRPGESWYRIELGGWTVLALDSNCRAAGGCGETAPQTQWLRAQLAGLRGRCVAAMWHHPMTTSTRGDVDASTTVDAGLDERFGPWWRLLREAGVALVLSGHAHNYERFAPQDDVGRPATSGPVQFVVGTGGHSLYPFAEVPRPASVFRADQFGHLELDLTPTGYAWRFVALGRGAIDQGTGSCPSLTG